jgi:hypothetical protein
MLIGLAGLNALLVIGAMAHPRQQSDWKQWTANEVKQVLGNSPWVSHCCSTYLDGDVPIEYEAAIVSSQTVRKALVRDMQLNKGYEKLDPALRQKLDQRISECLNEKYDDYIVIGFSFFTPALTPVNQIHLLTSDGRKIVGQPVNDSIGRKCGELPKGENWIAVMRFDSEIAFPRYVDGKPTITPTDKLIRIELDFYKKFYHTRTGGEFDFSIDKLIYQGKPDF